MEFEIYSYRYAREILEHPNHNVLLNEIINTITDCPLYVYPGKSQNNPNLDVIQQLLNTYFNRRFCVDFHWQYQPQATNIPNAGLTADFRRSLPNPINLNVHIEVQFGNIARWYSDIFKFQTAYSTNLIDIGVCIVPFQSLANRIDSNLTYYERCLRELPAAKMSITLPILLIGIRPNPTTTIFDISQSAIRIGQITNSVDNQYSLVNNLIGGIPINTISQRSAIGNRP
jgi:hypothetical protein